MYKSLLLFYTIPSLIVFWKLYEKAAKPGWAAIVPVYESVVMAEISGKPIWIGVVSGLFLVFSVSLQLIDNPILAVGRLVTGLFGLYLLNSFIKKYDRGLGFWFLAIFLPIIAVFLVGKANLKTAVPAPLPDVAVPGSVPGA